MKGLLMYVLGFSAVIVLVIPTVAVSQPSFAVDKGSNLIAGTAGFTNMSGDLYEWGDDSQSILTIAPSFAHFIIPNFAIGVNLSYVRMSVGDDSMTDIGVGPLVVYAFGKQESATYPYLGAGFNYLYTGNDDSVNGTSFSFAGGVFLLPAQQQHLGVTIEASVSFDSMKGDWEGAKSESGTKIGIGVGLVGFVF